MSEEQEKFTYRELRDFLNNADEQFLDNQVYLAGDETSTRVEGMLVFEEDYVYIPDSECSIPISEFDPKEYEAELGDGAHFLSKQDAINRLNGQIVPKGHFHLTEL